MNLYMRTHKYNMQPVNCCIEMIWAVPDVPATPLVPLCGTRASTATLLQGYFVQLEFILALLQERSSSTEKIRGVQHPRNAGRILSWNATVVVANSSENSDILALIFMVF